MPFTGQHGSRSFFMFREAMSFRIPVERQRFSTGSDRRGALGTLFVALFHRIVRPPKFPKFRLYMLMFRVTIPSAVCAEGFLFF